MRIEEPAKDAGGGPAEDTEGGLAEDADAGGGPAEDSGGGCAEDTGGGRSELKVCGWPDGVSFGGGESILRLLLLAVFSLSFLSRALPVALHGAGCATPPTRPWPCPGTCSWSPPPRSPVHTRKWSGVNMSWDMFMVAPTAVACEYKEMIGYK